MVERQQGERHDDPGDRSSPILKRATVYSAVFAAGASPGNGLLQKAVLGTAGVTLVGTADFWHWYRGRRKPPA